MTTNYNLLDEQWIPVLYRDGTYKRVGIRTALEEAGQIRQIAASNPMDNVALLRFLLAVLLWCKDDVKCALATLSDRSTGIHEDWLAKLDDHKTAFNLLGDDARFYQDTSLKDNESRPVADLLLEFPGADSVNHMRHVVHDGSYGFCPACCALGILRLSVWAPANRYYPASVNPGSAVYAVAEKENLLLTLGANLPEGTTQADQAPWLLGTPPKSPGAVANLAWRPRKLWLNVRSERGCCANCGISGILVESLCNEGGWPTPTTAGRTKKFWHADPHLVMDGEPIALPGLAANAGSHTSRFWRAVLRLRATGPGKVVAIGPVVNKFTFQDATSVSVPSTSTLTRAKLCDVDSNNLRGLLKQATPNPDRQHPEISAALVMLTPDTEAQIRATLDQAGELADDTRVLHEIYAPLVRRVVASTTCGSPLRRREAMQCTESALEQALQKTASNQSHDSSTEDHSQGNELSAAKSKRRRKKREAGT